MYLTTRKRGYHKVIGCDLFYIQEEVRYYHSFKIHYLWFNLRLKAARQSCRASAESNFTSPKDNAR